MPEQFTPPDNARGAGEPPTCPLCDRWFHNRKQLERHQVEVHRDRFPCLTCGARFFGSCRLRKHCVRLQHSLDVVFALPGELAEDA